MPEPTAATAAGRASGTPCSDPPCDTDPDSPCAQHDEEQAHADGEHQYCSVRCEIQMPTEPMRNFVLLRSYPGANGMLNELLRRAAAAEVTWLLGELDRLASEAEDPRATEYLRNCHGTVKAILHGRQIQETTRDR